MARNRVLLATHGGVGRFIVFVVHNCCIVTGIVAVIAVIAVIVMIDGGWKITCWVIGIPTGGCMRWWWR